MPDQHPRSSAWKWTVCGLLFLATMVMYLDRQTLALVQLRLIDELRLTPPQFGRLDGAFGIAFACGALLFGLLADRVSIRWLYPLVLLGWSGAGIATAWSPEIGRWVADALPGLLSAEATSDPQVFENETAYFGFMACRIVLGFFEAGHWPCALITTQRLLAAADRPLGNSMLQSGASFALAIAPLAVKWMLTPEEGSWRGTFIIVGIAGMFWVLPWLLIVRGRDLSRPTSPSETKHKPTLDLATLLRRIAVLLAIVIPINMTWQYFRVWLPLILGDKKYGHGYSEDFVFYFVAAYYIVTDIGCLAVGFGVKHLAARGWNVHWARVATFAVCTAMCAFSMAAATLPRGPLLIAAIFVIGFGSLGLFPTYYAMSQEISTKHQGLLTGALGFTTWIVTSFMQIYVGDAIAATKSYSAGLFWIGLVPLISLLAMALFWGSGPATAPPTAKEQAA
ncbi:MAG: MFS transporter [Pirellulaceae bacterium]|nr:MFS transporter [Pirellulaceae bacterium]